MLWTGTFWQMISLLMAELFTVITAIDASQSETGTRSQYCWCQFFLLWDVLGEGWLRRFKLFIIAGIGPEWQDVLDYDFNMTSVAVMYGELHNVQSTTCSGKVGHTSLWDSACTIQSCGNKSDPASKATLANTAIVSSHVRQKDSILCIATCQLHVPTCDRRTMFGLNRQIHLYVFGFRQHNKLSLLAAYLLLFFRDKWTQEVTAF